MTLSPSLRMSSWPGLSDSALIEGWRFTFTLRPCERMVTVLSSLAARYTPYVDGGAHSLSTSSFNAVICSRASYSALTSFSFWLKACTSCRFASRNLFSRTVKSLGVSSSFLRRWTVSASSDRMYAWRSWTWISYSVRRRRVLESDMEAGRNFEKPSRLGLLFLSNSFIAHPFSLDPLCAAQAHAFACSKYRRQGKRKSRLAGNLPPVDALNLLRFSTPIGPIPTSSP